MTTITIIIEDDDHEDYVHEPADLEEDEGEASHCECFRPDCH